jgi:2-methylcitrate dehydratase PrpD
VTIALPDGAADDGPTARLAKFVVTWQPDATTLPLYGAAKCALADILGTAVAGSTQQTSMLVSQLACREAAPGRSVVIGHRCRIAPTYAALVNGTSGHVLDYDDIGAAPGVGHPTVAVVPAALAVAEDVDASGRQLVEAIIVGYEVAARFGRASGGSGGDSYRRGFHGTAVNGVFGATAAAARLLGLDIEQTRCAFGIATSEAGGVRANVGTMTKPLHAGEVNRAGVLAAMLAQTGFTASRSAIEGRHGWGDAFSGGSYDQALIVDGLGREFALEHGVNVKSFPSCAAAHGAIRAVLSVLSEHRLGAEDVVEIEVEIAQEKLDDSLLFPWPATTLEGRFSLAFNVAAAWADGDVTVATFSEAKLGELASYRSRVVIRGRQDAHPVLVRVRTGDGRELTSPGLPDTKATTDVLSVTGDDTLCRKFRDNVSAVRSTGVADALLESIRDIENTASVGELTELLL